MFPIKQSPVLPYVPIEGIARADHGRNDPEREEDIVVSRLDRSPRNYKVRTINDSRYLPPTLLPLNPDAREENKTTKNEVEYFPALIRWS